MSEPLNSLHAALADRYTIEREIGRGGMATVYLARDVKHDRAVAVKVFTADFTSSLGAERFLREIHTAARLQHPHILPLYDSGEAGGFLYYVMPYLEGQSLRDRLHRERQLPLDEALRITREVAGALAYAHAHDVVHRDIKPENILFSSEGSDDTGGHALVADFGIARAISTATGNTLTQSGIAVGTPSYMSPEQASAESGVDGRADTYALGCVLYEMLAGHAPFLGTSAQEILARHARDPVPPLRTSRPELPEFIERAIAKAMAKTPADRFATTSAFTAALALPNATVTARRPGLPVVGAAVALVVLLAGYVVYRVARPPVGGAVFASAEATRSIAVLPFTNVGGDSANEPFSDGIADDLTTELGKIDGLIVTARQSAFSFKPKGLDARTIGRQLQVAYIVTGSVQRAENRRRVRAQLSDVSSGRELWSDTFEHDARDPDVFTVNDSITRSIVRQVLPRVSPTAMATTAKRATESPRAHDLYLQGRFYFSTRSAIALKKAQEYFEQAIAEDSTYALAYAGLSDAYSHASVFGYAPPGENFPKAKEYALRALALDSTLADAHASRAFIALFYEWDWPTAGREFDKALALDPRSSSAHLWHAWYFIAVGKVNEAIGEVRTAVDLDRFSSVNHTRLVSMLFYGRRYDEALAQALRTRALDPDFVGLRVELARVYVFKGRCAEALAELPQNQALASTILGIQGYAYAKCGRRPQALAELDRLTANAREGKYVSHYGLAVIQVALGNTQQAIAELESAYAERSWGMFTLRLDAAFDDLRSDPRFAALVRKVGL